MRTKNLLMIIGALSLPLLGLSFSACSKRAPDETKQEAPAKRYHCPMHPTYISDHPGDCPICGMRLVPMDEPTPAAVSGEKKILFYRNPMDPRVTSPVPAKDNMGMDYVPVYEGETEGTAPVAGQAAVRINPERQHLIGVTVAPVEKRELAMGIRASARVAYDPDLYNAILEHQQALQATPKSEAATLVRASELRLRQMGLSAQQIKAAGAPGFDPSDLLLPKPGGRVWIYIDVYEFEASSVKTGQSVELASPVSPGTVYKGTVRAIDSIVDKETRTLRVRADAVNIDGALRPETFLNAVIQVPIGLKLAVPATAVMDTGTRQLVYVETGAAGSGEYEPRAVALGKKAGDYYEVIGGVKEGERVVTSANFLVDSESKLKAAIQGK